MKPDNTRRNLPGADLVEQGLADLRESRDSDCALLVLTAGPSLARLGIEIPKRVSARPFSHLLYERLEDRLGNDAFSCYGSLIRRIVSFAHALEQQQRSAPGRAEISPP
jgi:hypothetical protein